MADKKRLIDANVLWKVLDEAGLFESGNPRHIAQQTVEEQPTVDAVEVSRLGKLGRLMMPYKSCPRGRIGAYGAVGGNTTVTEIHITELDAIVDVEGDRWIPVLADDLEKLKARANNAVEVVHGHWIYHLDYLFPTESTQECSICHEHEETTLYNESYCPNCGAKMDGDGNE